MLTKGRAGERAVRLSNAVVSGVRVAVHGTAYGQVTGLPERQDGVWYVVALPVAIAAPDRTDLLVCGPAVRDNENRMIGCKGLSVPHHPVARREPLNISRKREIAELLEAHTGRDSYWEDTSPSSLFGDAFDAGRISKEEMDQAQVNFGDMWFYAGT